MKKVNRLSNYILAIYSMYFVEFCLLVIINYYLFFLEYPNGNIKKEVNYIFFNSFLWSILLRPFFGYPIMLFWGLKLILKMSNNSWIILKVAITNITIYSLLSLLYAYVFFPETKDFLIWDLSYRGSYFYYSLCAMFIAPFLLSKTGLFKFLYQKDLQKNNVTYIDVLDKGVPPQKPTD